jgi:hypothetical protein
MRIIFALPVLALLLPGAAQASTNADQRLPPMVSGEEMPHLPDTVTPDGMHVGHWSAGDAKGAAQSKVVSPAASASAPADAAKTAPADGNMQHSMTVTSIQTCYDQLDPADAAEIRRDYLKPYAECQARLEAKLQGKREMKAGEAAAAATPESPRNYIRVQRPEPAAAAPAPSESPVKSGTKLNP